MFCNQCGNKVPEGSRFCSVCGTKLAVEVETPVARPAERPAVHKTSMTFDWSSVKDEPHKKYARDIVSPWTSTGMEEATSQNETVAETQPRTRTMSFIDILKKEREAKAAAEEAAAEEEKVRNAADPTPSVYMPPVYDDVSSPVITPFDTPERHTEEIRFQSATEWKSQQQVHAEPEVQSYIEPEPEPAPQVSLRYEPRPYAEAEPHVEAPQVSRRTQPVEVEEPEPIPEKHTPDFTSNYEEANKAKLTAELSAILDAGSGRVVTDETIDLFDDNRLVEDAYLAMEDDDFEAPIKDVPTSHDVAGYDATADIEDDEPAKVVVETPTPIVEEKSSPIVEEPTPIAEEPTIEVPSFDEHKEEPIKMAEFPAYYHEEEETEPEDELEALKRRLAELMGDTMTGQVEMPAPQMEESTPIFEEPAPIAEEVVETPAQEPTPVVEEPIYEEPVVEEPVVEETAEEPETVEDVVEAPVATEGAPIEETVVEEPEVVEESTPIVEDEVVETPVEEPTPVEEEQEEELPLIDPTPEVEEELPLIDPTPEVEEELPLINEEVEAELKAEAAAAAEEPKAEEPTTDAMSVEELEKDLFGEVSDADIQAEETKKIDKFYTLYKKNEEFQKLLDEEYNKLKTGNEEVPTVSAILGEDTKEEFEEEFQDESKNVAKEEVKEVIKKEAPVAAEVAVPVIKDEAPITEEDEEARAKGGAALTVIAVVVAVLLVVLLAVILVLNFAPDSAIALRLDSIIETITSYFSGVETPGNLLL